MNIGNVKIKNKVFLAPMAGVTDLPFRILCREKGCGLVYTEMVSAKGLMYDNENTQSLLDTQGEERPIAVQLFGSSPEILGNMAKKISEYPIDIIDINMGCPAPKIVKNGEGSALMKNPKLIEEIVRAVCSATEKPVTIKIRKGFDESSINAVEVAILAEKAGAAAITVHGRTREEFFSGNADIGIIKAVKEAVSIPVIGNGDVGSPQAAKAMLDETGCDAVMIGRSARGNPWIFLEIIHYLETGNILNKPTIEEKKALAIRHVEMLVSYKGEHIGVREARKHLAWYTKGIDGSAELRVRINKAETLAELEEMMA